MTVSEEFERLININSPIIVIKDFDFVRVDELISNTLGIELSAQAQEWNPSCGQVYFMNKEPINQDITLESFLQKKANDQFFKDERFIILKEIQDYIDNPVVKYSLELIGQRRLYDRDYSTSVIIVATILDIPPELEKYVSFLDIPFPDEAAIDRIIDSHIEINEYDKSHFTIEDRKTLRLSLKGMSEFDMDRVLDIAMSTNGSLSAADDKMILRKKGEMVKRSGVIELVDVSGVNLDQIGGLGNLKSYLGAKAKIFKEIGPAVEFGVSMPKGVFLVGMPGCGKSLCAKVTAATFDVPLLKMDMGSLMGKYLGQSEENMRKAIKTAEAASPCVLWIDEIEKAFSGVGGENAEVLTRMFGYFLYWLQEKKTPVYVVATANNADNLPPELKRKGRFDEVFCVNLPEEPEREEIFKVKINRLEGKDCYPSEDIDYKTLARKTVEFNGADIEAVVNEAVEQQYLAGKKKLNTAVLEAVADKTLPIGKSCEKQIKTMKAIFAESRFKNAYDGECIY